MGSCSVDEIDTFDSNDYLSFDSNSMSYTFAFSDSSVKSHDFEIPVSYAGRYRDHDADFSIVAVSDTGQFVAKEGVQYQMLDESNQVIPAGKNSGVAKIRLLRTQEMTTETYRVRLAIQANQYFKPGITDTMTVSVTDRLVKPDWWTQTPYNSYLGSYTETKLRLWLEFMGVTDGSDPFDTDEYIQWLDWGTGVFNHKSYRDSAVKPKVMEFHDWLIHKKGNPVDPTTGKAVSDELGSF